ncbi:MAG: hypothetical protein AABW64_01775 [Nanoarchaeota archaeon]
MKQGTFALYFCTAIYIFFLVYLLTDGFDPAKPAFGQAAVDLYSEFTTSRKVYFYLDQSVRNAMHLTLQDLEKNGLFDKKNCLSHEGSVVLFSQGSCTLTKDSFSRLFIDRFLTHYPQYFQQSVYGVEFPKMLSRDALHLRFEQDTLQLSGSLSNAALAYSGKKVSYSLPYSFSETLSTPLSDIFALYAAAQRELDCIIRHTTTAPTACPLSESGTWTIEEKDGYLFVTATSKRNISLAFAINLNTAQQPSIFS